MEDTRPPHLIRSMVVTAVVFLAREVARFVLRLDENRASNAIFFAGLAVPR